MRLVLASASPRRVELLRAAGFAFETRAVDVDERVNPGELPASYVQRLAAEKSKVAAGPLHEAGDRDVVVLGADTAVILEGEILGKPRDIGDAGVMLRRLSGRQHQVLTGISVRQGARELGRVEATEVWLSELTEEEIRWYVASGEGRDKAGAYAIQGLASRFIARIDGSYSNVVGLPVRAVYELLAELGRRP